MATMVEHGIIRSPPCSWWEEVEVGFAKAVDAKTQGKRQFSFDFGNLVTMEAPHDTVEQRPAWQFSHLQATTPAVTSCS